MYAWHSVNICLADYIFCLHRQSGKSNPGTFLKYKNFLRLIFFIFIYIIRALTALQKFLYNPNIFFINFEQITYNFSLIFLPNQVFSYNPRAFCFNASLMLTFDFSNICFFTVYSKSHFFYFPVFFLLFFTLLLFEL